MAKKTTIRRKVKTVRTRKMPHAKAERSEVPRTGGAPRSTEPAAANAVSKDQFLQEHQQESTLKHVAFKEISAIYDFSLKVVKDFGSLIKSIVVFGSFARGKISEKSDIDIMIIIDDGSVELTPDIMAFYNRDLDAILKKAGSELKFHVTTVSLSEYFDTIRRGDPLMINILRTGLPIVDAGFFAPMKLLLKHGKIRPTWESIELSKNRAVYHLGDYAGATLAAATSLYWAAVEVTHAAVMTKGATPASPELIAVEMAKQGIGTEDDWKTYQGVYDLMKTIVHRQKTEVSPEELRFWKDAVTKLVENMTKICNDYKEA